MFFNCFIPKSRNRIQLQVLDLYLSPYTGGLILDEVFVLTYWRAYCQQFRIMVKCNLVSQWQSDNTSFQQHTFCTLSMSNPASSSSCWWNTRWFKVGAFSIMQLKNPKIVSWKKVRWCTYLGFKVHWCICPGFRYSNKSTW